MADRQPSEAWQQAHVDIGALAQRVTGLESSVQDVRSGISELSKKLDAKPTNWWGIIVGVVAMLTLVGTLFVQGIAPINSNIDRHEREIGHIAETAINRSDYLRDRDETERMLGSLRDRIRVDEDGSVTQRQIGELKERVDERYRISQGASETRIGSLERRIDTLDSQLVKRPEIEASNKSQDERLTALSARSNAIQAQVDALFPPSKIIDELWRGLSELRTGSVVPK